MDEKFPYLSPSSLTYPSTTTSSHLALLFGITGPESDSGNVHLFLLPFLDVSIWTQLWCVHVCVCVWEGGGMGEGRADGSQNQPPGFTISYLLLIFWFLIMLQFLSENSREQER